MKSIFCGLSFKRFIIIILAFFNDNQYVVLILFAASYQRQCHLPAMLQLSTWGWFLIN